MSEDSIIKSCYFCDYPYKVSKNYEENIDEDNNYNGNFIYKYKDLWICLSCNKTKGLHHMNFSLQEYGECCVCLEEKILLQLPTCTHKICIQCCKTIYYGSTSIEPPTESRHDIINPDWPYEFYCSNEAELKGTRKDWMIWDDKEDEYNDFRNEYLDYTNKSYEELVSIRDSLISTRIDWMNTEKFINYENLFFHYLIDSERINKIWENYNNKKIKGNGTCPLCRETPFIYHRSF
jgi:hypothetical protein